MSKWTLTPFTGSPSLFLRAESPVNNHYLLNTLPFPSTECRKGVWRGRNNYLGLFFKDLQNGKQGNQLRKNMKYPLYATLPRHTHKAERYTHTPLFISTVSKEEIKNKKTWGLQDKCIYFQSTECSHIHLRILYPSTKLKQLDVLREASTHLLRKCALKNDCFSQRREKQQVTSLPAILLCGRFSSFPSPLCLPNYLFSLFFFFPKAE